MNKYEHARKIALKGVGNAIKAHKKCDYFSIESDLETFELAIPREEIEPNSLLFLTLEFWSAWADSANHCYWNFYPPLKEQDYLRIASILLKNLETNTEVSNEEIIKEFSTYPNKPLFSKFLDLFK